MKLHDWLNNNRVFGQYIENYKNKRGITVTMKIASITFLWTSLIVSAVLVQTVWVRIVLGLVGIGVSIHLLMIKTKKNEH
jgi:uncharacterized membrane protein YbaN (DUF454 family)